MSDSDAAGRKTETRFEEALTEQMALCREQIADCFRTARQWTITEELPLPEVACLTTNRGREIGYALDIINACAALTTAASKFKGEFDHCIVVTRETDGKGVPPTKTRGSNPQ